MFLGLDISDLRSVRNAMWSARNKWFDIGLELNIDSGTLDVIYQNERDMGRCLMEMLTVWLRTESKPTWTALAKALRSASVGHHALAEQLLVPGKPMCVWYKLYITHIYCQE